MSNFGRYMMSLEKTQRAKAEYESASRGLENARIHERMAEVMSQSNPIDDLVNNHLPKDAARMIAFYVVVGRMPKPEEVR